MINITIIIAIREQYDILIIIIILKYHYTLIGIHRRSETAEVVNTNVVYNIYYNL